MYRGETKIAGQNKPDVVALLAQQVEESPFATAITRENIIIYANRQFRAEALRDKQIEDPIGMSIVELEYGNSDDDLKEMIQHWRQSGSDLRRTDFEFNGIKYAELLATTLIRVDDVDYHVGTSVDISFIKEAESALEDALVRLEKAQGLARIGDFVSEVDSQEFNGSAEAMRILGFEPQQRTITTSQLFAQFHPEDSKGVIEIVTGLEAAGSFEVEHRLHPDLFDERWVFTKAAVDHDAKSGARLVRGTVQDITERKRAELEREKFNRKMQETQKLESLGVLAGGIAHDFNNLLAGIMGNADFALLEKNLSPEMTSRLQDIVAASRRAADLTRQLLAYSGKGRFVIEPVNLSELIQEMSDLLKMTTSKEHALRFSLAPDLPSTEVDSTQIRQLMMNLIINAGEAIEHGSGMVSVSTGFQHCDEEYLDAAELNDPMVAGDYVYFEVSDNGSGMDQKTIRKIFDPFFTTKFTGRGLGLAAALGIAQGHGGAIKIYSELGKGTTFKVFLPASTVDAASTDEAIRDEPGQGSGLILIIDDDETVCQFISGVLGHYGYEVLIANDGKKGIDVFSENLGRVQLVLLDLTMPNMDGKETYARLRTLRPGIPTILMSGYNEQDATQHFVGKGLAGFLPKPFLVNDLLDLVRLKIGNQGRE